MLELVDLVISNLLSVWYYIFIKIITFKVKYLDQEIKLILPKISACISFSSTTSLIFWSFKLKSKSCNYLITILYFSLSTSVCVFNLSFKKPSHLSVSLYSRSINLALAAMLLRVRKSSSASWKVNNNFEKGRKSSLSTELWSIKSSILTRQTTKNLLLPTKLWLI